jgi:hypothetical protein
MVMPIVKRFSMGPFGFFGLGGGGAVCGAGAAWVVWAGGGLDGFEFEAQPHTPAITAMETRILTTDVIFIVLQWVFIQIAGSGNLPIERV